jgi:hypothetical protein
MGRLAEYVERKFGFKTREVENPVTSTVGTSPTLILRNNPDRIAILIVNLSDNDGYVGWFNDVSATKGIRLTANGGNVHLIADEDGELVSKEFYGVNLYASGTWYIAEVEAAE